MKNEEEIDLRERFVKMEVAHNCLIDDLLIKIRKLEKKVKTAQENISYLNDRNWELEKRINKLEENENENEERLKEFVFKAQKPKMKELWNNEKDKVWEDE